MNQIDDKRGWGSVIRDSRSEDLYHPRGPVWTGIIVTWYGTAPQGWHKNDGSTVKILDYKGVYLQLKAGGYTPLNDDDGIHFDFPNIANTIIKV